MSKFGNFSQFSKDELSNLLTILGIGYFRGTTLLLLSLNAKDKESLLPYDLSKPPYNNANTDGMQGMLEYLFSLKSDFPYHIKVMNDSESYVDGSLDWLGGITAYSFSCIRYCICMLTDFINPVLKKESYTGYIINMLIFYILPIILNALLMPPIFIPMISLGTSFLGSLYQSTIKTEKKAFVYFFGWIFTWMLIEHLSNIQLLPYNFIFYFLRIWYSFITSFFLMPVVWFLTAISIWIYTIIIWVFLPFFIKDGIKQVRKTMEDHAIGLIILFMLYTLYSAHKSLTSPFVYGMAVSFLFILLFVHKTKTDNTLFTYGKQE
jgi:hypothetical protein